VAVDKALARLSQNQNPDGSWNGGFGGNRDPAVSALCVMAFLSAGHVPGEGPYGAAVERTAASARTRKDMSAPFGG